MGTPSARRSNESFRLELTSVRNTLFIHPSHKPGSSQAGPPAKKVRHDPRASVPDWAAGALGHVGTHAPKLPYSGGHYRLVRYRFGHVVLAVRVKVDLVYEHRKDSNRSAADPLRDVQPQFMPRQHGDVAQVWRTTVKTQGIGTRPANAGVASVRYAWQDPKEQMRSLLPRVWFSRTPFVIDCQVSYPDLRVGGAKLVNSRQWYPSYERGYQGSLRRLAGLLRHLQERTREMGGNIVLIADPVQVCFVLLKPVINKPALPVELVLKFWGQDTEKEERERQAEMDRDSTPEQEQSDLTDLSDTPSLPPGSDIANVRQPQPGNSQADVDETSSRIAGGSPTRAERQIAEGIDPVRMVKDWNKSVDNPVRQSVEADDGPVHDNENRNGNEDDAQYDADASFDGHRSSSQGSVMVGESAHEPGCEGADAVLNDLALQMNTAAAAGAVAAAAHEAGNDDRMAAVARSGGTEVLRGGHSLLMADRHLTAGMHTSSSSSDGEWPPEPKGELHGRITNVVRDHQSAGAQDYLASRPNSPFTPDPPTPLGPSDFDEDWNVIDRHRRNRDQMEADSSGGEDAAAPPAAPRVPEPRRRRFGGRSDLTASGRARLSEPNAAWRRRYRVEADSDEGSHATSSQGEEDDSEDSTSVRGAGQESGQGASQGSASGNHHATTNGYSAPHHQGSSSERQESDEYDPAHEF